MDRLNYLEKHYYYWENIIKKSFHIVHHLQNENCVYKWKQYSISNLNEIFITMINEPYNWE